MANVIVDNVSINAKLAKLIDGETRLFAQSTFYKHMTKFVPRQTGVLMSLTDKNDSDIKMGDAEIIALAQSSGNITIDGVRFTAQYASRMYYGDGFNFRTDMNPLAMAHWNVGVDKDVLSREIEKYIRTRKVSKK